MAPAEASVLPAAMQTETEPSLLSSYQYLMALGVSPPRVAPPISTEESFTGYTSPEHEVSSPTSPVSDFFTRNLQSSVSSSHEQNGSQHQPRRSTSVPDMRSSFHGQINTYFGSSSRMRGRVRPEKLPKSTGLDSAVQNAIQLAANRGGRRSRSNDRVSHDMMDWENENGTRGRPSSRNAMDPRRSRSADNPCAGDTEETGNPILCGGRLKKKQYMLWWDMHLYLCFTSTMDGLRVIWERLLQKHRSDAIERVDKRMGMLLGEMSKAILARSPFLLIIGESKKPESCQVIPLTELTGFMNEKTINHPCQFTFVFNQSPFHLKVKVATSAEYQAWMDGMETAAEHIRCARGPWNPTYIALTNRRPTPSPQQSGSEVPSTEEEHPPCDEVRPSGVTTARVTIDQLRSPPRSPPSSLPREPSSGVVPENWRNGRTFDSLNQRPAQRQVLETIDKQFNTTGRIRDRQIPQLPPLQFSSVPRKDSGSRTQTPPAIIVTPATESEESTSPKEDQENFRPRNYRKS
ncbi:hypothetical protein BJ742DRAFT_850214 [Cladochytrium replicatum]|nr:hypothetical protein BJ742DRAFT_850214 [Cladochytrium replicatum]